MPSLGQSNLALKRKGRPRGGPNWRRSRLVHAISASIARGVALNSSATSRTDGHAVGASHVILHSAAHCLISSPKFRTAARRSDFAASLLGQDHHESTVTGHAVPDGLSSGTSRGIDRLLNLDRK